MNRNKLAIFVSTILLCLSGTQSKAMKKKTTDEFGFPIKLYSFGGKIFQAEQTRNDQESITNYDDHSISRNRADLFKAAKIGDYETVKKLLEKGINPNEIEVSCKTFMTPFERSVLSLSEASFSQHIYENKPENKSENKSGRWDATLGRLLLKGEASTIEKHEKTTRLFVSSSKITVENYRNALKQLDNINFYVKKDEKTPDIGDAEISDMTIEEIFKLLKSEILKHYINVRLTTSSKDDSEKNLKKFLTKTQK